MPKKVLGKGLEALIPHAVSESIGGEILQRLPVDTIDANPLQPRKRFDGEKLQQLASSIKADGVLQPVVVRRKGSGYELIMGERRLQAARLAGLPAVPAIVKDTRDPDSLRLALVENLQREDLNAIEVARAYRQLVAEYGLSQQDVARLVGRDRSSVANTIRLLQLPAEVQQMIIDETLSGGHARALLSLPTQKEQLAMARRIVERSMSVRDAESATGVTRPKRVQAREKKERPAYLRDLENTFCNHLGTKVSIVEKRGGKGRITIEFYSHDDFERLASMMHIPLPR
ncbi:MAG: ParB/RepB/Spo0J family partition protein [Candidatus Krumholzibacteria bacterium]|nr:ParB/RepB/Spo0J family partition protein [Candidatus Krumholzibacteria bacterium]